MKIKIQKQGKGKASHETCDITQSANQHHVHCMPVVGMKKYGSWITKA